MSLNGLDHPTVKEAHEAAVAEPGGWYVILFCPFLRHAHLVCAFGSNQTRFGPTWALPTFLSIPSFPGSFHISVFSAPFLPSSPTPPSFPLPLLPPLLRPSEEAWTDSSVPLS